MTNDQVLLMAAVEAASSMTLADGRGNRSPQETVTSFFEYLDTTVAAMPKRAKYYSEQYNLSIKPGGDQSSDVGGLLEKLGPVIMPFISTLSSAATPELAKTIVALLQRVQVPELIANDGPLVPPAPR